jgi:glycosyltransferase involved in cell wall biosynthesis
MNKPKISVIIPVYNSEKYLENALDSVLNQTFQDFEILCIDDGSQDSSAKIIKNYSQKDKRVQYFYQKNQGPGPARNKGIKKAKGDFISFLDSDDYLEKDALRRTYDIAMKKNLDLVLFNAQPIYESLEIEKKHNVYTKYYKRKNTYEEIHSGEDLFSKQVANYDFLPHVGFQLIKKSLILENNNFFINALHEDNLFTIKNLLLAKRVFHINKVLYIRRLRADSIMTTEKSIKNVHGYFITILRLIELIKEGNFNYKTVLTIAEIIDRMQSSTSKMLMNLEDSEIDDYLKTLSHGNSLLFNSICYNLSKKSEEQYKKYLELEKQLKQETRLFQENKKVVIAQKEKLDSLDKDLITLKNKLENTKKDLVAYKTRLERIQKELQGIKESKSYKIGKVVTYIPRKIKNVFKNLKRKT